MNNTENSSKATYEAPTLSVFLFESSPVMTQSGGDVPGYDD